MKLIRKAIDKDGRGQVILVPEEQEDMWHAFNLIEEGDYLRCSAIRKVTMESTTGTTSSQRVHTTLTISVETIDFDTQACSLHVKGRNIEENQHVKTGAYHTLDLEPNRKFTLTKSTWDVLHLERIDLACDPSRSADVAAIVMQEGLAHVCLLTSAMTLVRAKIDLPIPRKRKGNASQHDKGMIRFLNAVSSAFLRHVDLDIIKCVLVASPGFVRDQFMDCLLKQGHKVVTDNRFKFLLVHSSNGFKHALKEVLLDPIVSSRLADTKAQMETKALEQFYSLLATDPDRAYYGIKHVQLADEQMAVEALLLTDSLFRSKDVQQRRQLVKLVESVRDQNGGVVRIFSSLHISGEQLAQLGGIAAILRFPLQIEYEDKSDSETEK